MVRGRSQGEPSPAHVVLITEEDLNSLEPKCEYFTAKQKKQTRGHAEPPAFCRAPQKWATTLREGYASSPTPNRALGFLLV